MTMRLSEYLKREDEGTASFAARVGVSPEAVRLWLTGRRFPRGATLKSIERATRGDVKPSDFDYPEAAE